MRFLRAIVLIAIGIALLSVCIVVMNRMDHYFRDSGRVAFILNIPEIPASVRNIACSASAVTDVMVTCAFEVDPAEFDRLLAGWQFGSATSSGSGSSSLQETPLGRDFSADVEYSAEPAEFSHGVRVALVSNKERTLVVANRYEE